IANVVPQLSTLPRRLVDPIPLSRTGAGGRARATGGCTQWSDDGVYCKDCKFETSDWLDVAPASDGLIVGCPAVRAGQAEIQYSLAGVDCMVADNPGTSWVRGWLNSSL